MRALPPHAPGQARCEHGEGAARTAERGKRALIARLPDALEGCRSACRRTATVSQGGAVRMVGPAAMV